MDNDFNLIEYGKMLREIERLTEDVKEGRMTIKELIERLEDLERRARQNDQDHQNFVKHSELKNIEESLKKLENSVVVMTPGQAKEAGSNWLAILLKNPTYTMWVILGVVIISMVLMGYSFVEISQVMDRLK